MDTVAEMSARHDRINDVMRQVALLPLDEQLLLVERIVQGIRSMQPAPGPRVSWRDVRGKAPYPLLGEDAQQWVSRTRRDDTEHREQVVRGGE